MKSLQAINPGSFDINQDFETAQYVAEVLHRSGYEAFLIGGAVRDIWLGREPKDFDLVTNATPQEIRDIPELSRSKYKDPAQAYGVTRVKIARKHQDSEIEVATFRRDIDAHEGRKSTKIEFSSLEDDVLRRDLTINGLAYDLVSNFIIDYVDGVEDLISKRIRFIGNPLNRIREDPLRIMRAIRIRHQLGFRYDPQTRKALKKATTEGFIGNIAIDRLRDEFTALLMQPNRKNAIVDLDRLGVLDIVLPEVVAGKGVVQPPEFHAEGDVWKHQLLIMDYLPDSPSRRLVWAALLHDIGKAPTSRIPQSEGRIRFDRHYAVGAEMAKAILRRLRFSNRDINDICWMVYNHMAIDDLPSMKPSKQQRMLGHPAFEDLLELHRVDAAASWRPEWPHGKKPRFRGIERIWNEYQQKSPEVQQPSLKRDLGIDGNWLIRELGEELNLNQGPILGEILYYLENWYRDEGITELTGYKTKAREVAKKVMRKSEHKHKRGIIISP
jgi:poly(A) polymerase